MPCLAVLVAFSVDRFCCSPVIILFHAAPPLSAVCKTDNNNDRKEGKEVEKTGERAKAGGARARCLGSSVLHVAQPP